MRHLLLIGLGVTLLTLTTCSKSSTDPAPKYKSHTLTFTYNNTGLNTSTYNLGAGVRVVVDKKAIVLGNSAADTIYYIQPQNSTTEITFPRTLNVQGANLLVETGFYNVYGTMAQPLDKSGNPFVAPKSVFQATIILDGRQINGVAKLGDGVSSPPVLPYVNGKNPTATLELDLTKF